MNMADGENGRFSYLENVHAEVSSCVTFGSCQHFTEMPRLIMTIRQELVASIGSNGRSKSNFLLKM